jgi:DHA1 family bicyclomycin/chloramphenicol resistance-like MFS transporter
MLSRSFESLLFFRFISALGGCSSGVAARTMVRDFFPPKDAAKIFSLLMLILSVSPLLAPSVGSLLVHVVGWRAIFGILAAIGVANILMILLVLPAGQDPDPSVVLRFRPILRNFQAILKNVQFSTFTIAGALSFTGLFVYVAGSPAIFMEGFHVSAGTYGGIFAMLACGMIGGGQISMLLGRRFSPKNIFRAALALQVLVALLFLIATYSDLAGLYGTILFLFLILMTAGITYPNASALAIEPFTKNIGSASALQGFLQLGIGAFTSAAVGLLKTKGALPTAATMSASSLLAGAILLWTDVFSRRRRVP